MKHRQVLIKVNAKCDEGIAPLVATLNEINGLITLDSCERGILGESYVFFTWGKNWRELGHLLEVFYEILTGARLDEYCSLRIEWCDKREWPRALMVMPNKYVAILAEDIRRLVPQINLRMSESGNGTANTELGRLMGCQARQPQCDALAIDHHDV